MRQVLGGLVAGLSATLLMEYASDFVWKRQSERSRERENELRSAMPDDRARSEGRGPRWA